MNSLFRWICVCLWMTSPVFAGEVTTLIGDGTAGFHQESGATAEARINNPYGLVIGPDGALYVCEIGNHIVRRIDLKDGTTTIAAGSGSQGYAGDGGPAGEALLNEPYEVRFAANGDMYFVEMKNNLVRKVSAADGTISTVAGTGTAGFGGDGGPATQAKLKQPHSIALDHQGRLFICDIGNHRVRVVDLADGVIRTFAGTGARQPTPDGAAVSGTPLNGPRALDVDSKNNLFLALREGNAVYRIDVASETFAHLAGTGQKGFTGNGGPAVAAKLSGPKGIALGPNGDVYLADTESHTIRVIRMKTGTIETLVGDGKVGDGPGGDPASCRLARPHGIYVAADGKVYIGDSENHRVRVYAP